MRKHTYDSDAFYSLILVTTYVEYRNIKEIQFCYFYDCCSLEMIFRIYWDPIGQLIWANRCDISHATLTI